MKKVLFSLFLTIGLIALGLTGCGTTKESLDPQKTITIGVMPDVESIPLIIAEKNGYFANEGVQVKIEHFKSAKDRDSALQSGLLDGVVTDFVGVVFANEGGIDLRIISKTDGTIELMAGENSGISHMNQLKGKSVGMSTNTIMDYTIDKMLAAAQLKPEEIGKVSIPALPTRLEMLQGGKIDAAILPQPLAGLAVKNGARVLSSTNEIGYKAGAIAFTASSIEQSPAEIKVVFRAYNQAVEYLQKAPQEEYVDYIIETLGLPPAVRDDLQLPGYQAAQAPDAEILADVVRWMKAKELIQGDYEYDDLVDDTILR